MKLKDLQKLIFSDLVIKSKNIEYTHIDVYGDTFKSLENREVIGIRSRSSDKKILYPESYIEILIK